MGVVYDSTWICHVLTTLFLSLFQNRSNCFEINFHITEEGQERMKKQGYR